MPYRVEFAESAKHQFLQLSARQRSSVFDQIRKHLQHEPLRETRKRKQLRPNPVAPWELRIGALRAFYEIDADESDLVNILALGIKRGNRLFVAGKEINL